MKKIFALIMMLFCLTSAWSQKKYKTENVILITLDGMRWQEVFTGADPSIIRNKDFTEDSVSLKKKFWATDINERRKLLMPFVWNTIAAKGQLFGNRTKNNFVNVTNQMWFSYPGYNEILTGTADDIRINSNDKNDNPNITFLEKVNQQPAYKNKVAAFTSWDCFPAIVNTKRSGVLVNAGIDTYQGSKLNDSQKLLNQLISELPYLGETRPDALTFHLGFEYLKQNNPFVLFMSFDETDHFAHEGKYDLYLQSARYTDNFINELWTWLQSQLKYKDKTTLIITTDHGRGDTRPDAWRHHGRKETNCDQIWMAMIGPDTPDTGEQIQSQQHYQNQVAATIMKLLSIPFEAAGKPVEEAIVK